VKNFKFNIGDKVVMDPKNKHISGWKDCGVGEVVEQHSLYRYEKRVQVWDRKDNAYSIVWASRFGYTCIFEDSLMPAPETKLNPNEF